MGKKGMQAKVCDWLRDYKRFLEKIKVQTLVDD